MHMKIGIYLAYKPYNGYSLKGEGLGRYLIKLISNLHGQGCEISVACPLWLTDAMEELFRENNFSLDNVEFITPRSDSVLWKYVSRKKKRSRKRKRSFYECFYNTSYSLAENAVSLLSNIRSNLILILLLILSAVAGIILLPFGIVFGLFWAISKLFCQMFKIEHSVGGLKSLIKRAITLNGRLTNMLAAFRGQGLSEVASESIRMDAVKSMKKRMSAMKKPVDVWYSPMAFWPEISELPGVTVTCFPDITPALFAQDFTNLDIVKSLEEIRSTVRNSKYFIVYSKYQKDQILAANLGVDKDHIVPIPLFVNNTLEDVKVCDHMNRYFNNPSKIFSKSLMNSLISHAPADVQVYLNTYNNSFSLKDMKYIFYSSQCRPNKNIITLVKAYEYLLRKKEVSFKLVLTGAYSSIPLINDYIHSHRLQYDILSFHMVSNQQLAALYACADLVVNPTIFEGGFPMTFAEGMAVGTPSVMGTIPQVTDVTDQFDMSDCLFDPFDYKDMAEKILYGVQNREKLYQKQLPLYNSLVTSTEEEYGKDYIDAFKYFIELDKAEKAEHSARNKSIDGIDSAV